MKKQTLPRVLSVLLVSSMAVGLCGCGKGGTSTSDKNKASHFFKTEYLDGVMNQTGKEISTVKIVGDKLYYCSYDTEEYTEQTLSAYDVVNDTETTLWISDTQYSDDDIRTQWQYIEQFAVDKNENVYASITTSTVKEESLNQDFDNATLDDVISYMVEQWGYAEADAQTEWENFYLEEYTDEDGNVNYGKFLMEVGLTYDGSSTLIKMDSKGNILYEQEMAKGEEDENVSSYCDGMLADAEGNLYLSMNEWSETEDRYYIDIMDGDGQKKGTVELAEYCAGLMSNYDGTVSYLTWGADGYDTYLIDPSSCTAEKTGSVTDTSVVYYDEEHFFVSDGTTLYLQSTKDDTKEAYLNWIDYNISGSSVSAYGIMSTGDLLVYTQNWMGEGQDNQIIRLTEVDESEVVVAQNITIACMWLDSVMEQKAIEFNKKHDDYHIVIRQFNDTESDDWQESLNAFTTAVANDTSIDIVIFNDYSQVTNFAGKGLMMDMYDLIDNDKELSREDFLPNILTACEIDGKLVVLPTAFSLQTLIGKSEDVGDEPGWTIQEMQDLLASKPQGTQLLYGMTRDQALTTCLNLGYSEFIDVTNATCDFDNEDFVNVLEFANMFPEEFEWNEEDDESVMLNTGKVLLSTYDLSDFQQVQMYSTIFGGDVTYIGYPTTEGNGALLNLNEIYGITNNCQKPEVAWEFLRQFYLPKEENTDDYYYYGFSVRKDDFEKYCENAMKEDENNGGTWGWGNFEVEIKPATQEQVDDVKELVYNTTAISGALSDDIKNIIDEEAAYYFSGEQSAKDVAAKIQSRMQIYLSETK